MSSIDDLLKDKKEDKVEDKTKKDVNREVDALFDDLPEYRPVEEKIENIIPVVPEKPIIKEKKVEEKPIEKTELPEIRKEEPTRKEKRALRRTERKKTQLDFYKFIIIMSTVSVFFLLTLYSYTPENETLFSLILLVGAVLFLPIGMILGSIVLDPYMRCKMLRRATKKNLGIVNFVGKGRRITSRIKDFDQDFIWIKSKCWSITKQGIYEVDKYGKRIGTAKVIDPEDLITMTETVPVIFIDLNNMQPLALHEIKGEGITPSELGANLTGWVDNQQAKLMFLKRTMETYYMILIVVAIAAAYFGYQNSQEIAEMRTLIQGLASKIDRLIGPGLIGFF